MINRVYTKVFSSDEFDFVRKNPDKTRWWHDSQCSFSVAADFSKFIGDIFTYEDNSAPVIDPQLVCAEVCY